MMFKLACLSYNPSPVGFKGIFNEENDRFIDLIFERITLVKLLQFLSESAQQLYSGNLNRANEN